MPSYPLATLAATITEAGVSYPTYSDTLASLKASYQLIYGADTYLEADSQDGQWLAFLAQLVYDLNQSVEAAYLNMDPDFAQGTALSSLVKLNGLQRAVATKSTVDLVITGTVGTSISNGQASDIYDNVWLLPTSVVIGSSGSETVTATAAEVGAIAAAAGTVTTIRTPVYGWASVTNPAAASPGAPVEKDPQLRSRQTSSTQLPAQTLLGAIVAAVQDVSGVTEVIGYDNDDDVTDSRGLPGHSLALVVSGGDSSAIAQAINLKKAPGTRTHGTTSITVTDLNGAPKSIKFFRPTAAQYQMAITIKALRGYTSSIPGLIKSSLSDYIAALASGATIIYSRLYFPAQLFGQGDYWSTYEVTALQIGPLAGALGSADITQSIEQNAVLSVANISITVTV